ncbi:MAG: endopeptidase La [Candidatus Shikimatogenerans bostrichidophilus]|nr:MAG: endopeptidase La [Candidatus Shikimatogenerans bostrichidophilus]
MINHHSKIIILKPNYFIKNNVKLVIDILLINNFILFPGIILPINIREKKVISHLYYKIYKRNKYLGLLNVKNVYNNYDIKNIYKIGIITSIIKIFKMPDYSITIVLQGVQRFKIIKKKIIPIYINILYKSNVLALKEKKFSSKDKDYYGYLNSLKENSIKIIKFNNYINKDIIYTINYIKNIYLLIFLIIIHFKFDTKINQIILKENSIKKRCKILLKFLLFEIKKNEISLEINNKVKNDISKQQIEYFLNQQIKAIQDKLGYNYNNEIDNLIKIYKKKIKKLSKDAKKKFNNELLKLKKINPQIPEYSIIKNYLDFLLNLPWKKYSKDNFNLKEAINILNNNHYGLKRIKNRILEYLSILKLKKNIKSPILCFMGPPGVGKTSLGKSISKVLSRKYIRMSLGGIHDESEIRGHRKTYIGAMPGRILQLINKVGTSNPVFILDEIDKIGIGGYNGDPAYAMLEVLDPEQNKSFYDNFLEIGYDLSKILFIATANDLNNINNALLDRMEIINISGYTIEEKIKISKKFLLPKLIKRNGLKKIKFNIKNKNIENIIINYTYESGIRNLERCIDKIFRYIAKNIVMHKKYITNINNKLIYKILGPNYSINKYEKIKNPGVSIGLAWTGMGGDIIYIESSLLKKGKGNISITGNVGKIMKESIIIAIKYIRSNYKKFKININLFSTYDLHIHVPEGAIPKDGPSAGIAILTSLISTYTNIKLKNNMAMTGEITLRGRVLPVGGIKEKILAAKRSYIKYIILPRTNKKNVKAINKKYLIGLKFYFINYMDKIIDIAFSKKT